MTSRPGACVPLSKRGTPSATQSGGVSLRNQEWIRVAGVTSEFNGWDDYCQQAGFNDESDPNDSEEEDSHNSKHRHTDADWLCQSAVNA